jgi:hypothetical protein
MDKKKIKGLPREMLQIGKGYRVKLPHLMNLFYNLPYFLGVTFRENPGSATVRRPPEPGR